MATTALLNSLACCRCLAQKIYNLANFTNQFHYCVLSKSSKRLLHIKSPLNQSDKPLPTYADSNLPEKVENMLRNDMIVIDDFVSEMEESELLKEIEPYMARLRYEYSHWDDAIHGYRETERSSWNSTNTSIINRLKEKAFCNVNQPTDYVHVLDLEKDGMIKPHKDSIRFCGDTIAGISLLSACVMRLVAIHDKDISVDILLNRRSLYIMRNSARFDFTHEILHNDKSYFKENHMEKGRRISIICRNNPVSGGDG